MADTETQMNVHAVFSIKGRGNFISANWCGKLYRYIAVTLKETKMSIWNYLEEMKSNRKITICLNSMNNTIPTGLLCILIGITTKTTYLRYFTGQVQGKSRQAGRKRCGASEITDN